MMVLSNILTSMVVLPLNQVLTVYMLLNRDQIDTVVESARLHFVVLFLSQSLILIVIFARRRIKFLDTWNDGLNTIINALRSLLKIG